MLTLLKYKYRAGRRGTMRLLVVWTIVAFLFLFLILLAFGGAFLLLQGKHFLPSDIGIWLLWTGIFILGMNVGIEGEQGTLTRAFAQELEYLSMLPISLLKVLFVQYMGWFATNILGIGILVLAPLLAAQLDQSLPFPLTWVALLAIATYSLLILFAGGWLKVISLRHYSLIAAPIKWAQLILTVVIVLLAIPKLSSLLPLSLTTGVLNIALFPVLPSAWAVLAMSGQWLFDVPLFVLLGMVMWRMSARIKDSWAIEIRPTQHRSHYPFRLVSGSGWAIAKYLVVEALANPTLGLVSQIVMSMISFLLIWYLWQPDIHMLFLLSSALGFQSIGVRLYAYLIASCDKLVEIGLPIPPNEILRGFCCVLGIACLPVFFMAFTVGGYFLHWSSNQLLSFCFAPIVSCFGIVALAFCAWKKLPLLWAFATFGIFQVLASFLL